MVLARETSEGGDSLAALADDLGLPRHQFLTYNRTFPSVTSHLYKGKRRKNNAKNLVLPGGTKVRVPERVLLDQFGAIVAAADSASAATAAVAAAVAATTTTASTTATDMATAMDTATDSTTAAPTNSDSKTARAILTAIAAAGGVPKEERWGHGDPLPHGANWGKNPDCTVADQSKRDRCYCHTGRLRAIVRLGEEGEVLEEYCTKAQCEQKLGLKTGFLSTSMGIGEDVFTT